MDRSDTRFQGEGGGAFGYASQPQMNNNNRRMNNIPLTQEKTFLNDTSGGGNNNNNRQHQARRVTDTSPFALQPEGTFLGGFGEKSPADAQQQQHEGRDFYEHEQPSLSNDGTNPNSAAHFRECNQHGSFGNASFVGNSSSFRNNEQECCHHPLRILLVRHGLAESNVDKSVYRTKPDHAIELVPEGKEMARRAGQAIHKYFADTFGDHEDSTQHIRLMCSPFLRTRQTAECLLEGMRSAQLEDWKENREFEMQRQKDQKDAAKRAGGETNNDDDDTNENNNNKDGEQDKKDEGPTFWVNSIRESPFLAEQDFGALEGEGDSAIKYKEEVARMKLQRDFLGSFWARAPHGESYFQVCNRLVGVINDIVNAAKSSSTTSTRSRPVRTVIVVTHGVTLRAFLTVFRYYSPEWLSSSQNPPNCAVRLLVGAQDCGYLFGGFNSVKDLEKYPNGLPPESIKIGTDEPKATWSHVLSRIRHRQEEGASNEGEETNNNKDKGENDDEDDENITSAAADAAVGPINELDNRQKSWL